MEKADGPVIAESLRDDTDSHGFPVHTFDQPWRFHRKRVTARYFSRHPPGLVLSPLRHTSSRSSSNESLTSSGSEPSSYSGPSLSLSSRSSVSGYVKRRSDEDEPCSDEDVDSMDSASFPHLKSSSSALLQEVESSPTPSNLSQDNETSATARVVVDDSMTRDEPTEHVDFLGHDWMAEDIWATWSYIVSRREAYGKISRLENAAWRTWAKSMNGLQTFPAHRLNWLKESDVTWLYGPLMPGRRSQLTSDVNKHPLGVPIIDPSKEEPLMPKGILRKRTAAADAHVDPVPSSSLAKDATATLVRPSVNFLLADKDSNHDGVAETPLPSFRSTRLHRAAFDKRDNTERSEGVHRTGSSTLLPHVHERSPPSAGTLITSNAKPQTDGESSVVEDQLPPSEVSHWKSQKSRTSGSDDIGQPFKLTVHQSGGSTGGDEQNLIQAPENDGIIVIGSDSFHVSGSTRDTKSRALLNHALDESSLKKHSIRKACVRCRARRVQCDGNTPCSACSRHGVECYINEGPKKILLSETYLRELQRKSKAPETPISELLWTDAAKAVSVKSCTRCRLRKTRCDDRDPCSSCSQVGADCHRREIGRKLYVPQAYVEELEQKVLQFNRPDSQPTAVHSAFLNFAYEDNEPGLIAPLMPEFDSASFKDGLGFWEEALKDRKHLGKDQLATLNAGLALDAEAVQKQPPRSPADLHLDAALASQASAIQTPRKRGNHDSREVALRSTWNLWPPALNRSLVVFAITTSVVFPLGYTAGSYVMSIQDGKWNKAVLSYYIAGAIQLGWIIAAIRVFLPLSNMERRSLQVISRRPANVGILSFQLWLHRVMPMSLLRVLRPNVKRGCQRLEWKCPCGRAMYGDYAKHDNIQNANLPQSLPGCRIVDATPNSTRNFSNTSAGDQDRLDPHYQKTVYQRLVTYKQSLMTPLDRRVGSDGFSRVSKEADAAENDPLDTPAAPPANHQDAQSALSNSNFSMPAFSNASDRIGSEGTRQVSDTSSSRSASAAKLCDSVPAFFELCVNGSKTRVSLGEITIRDGQGKRCINTDLQLFKTINEEYHRLRRKGLYTWLYRPSNIHFVRFGVHRGGYQTGIYEKPLAVPPTEEIKEQRYHYYECPLDPLPPIDPGTFFHYFWDYASHPESNGHPGFDTLFFNRLPKKLGDSILKQADPGKLQLGWGVHIIEGPNKPLLAWLATGILVLSFIISLVYDMVLKNRESGFAIGQWIVAVLGTALTAMYFHLADLV